MLGTALPGKAQLFPKTYMNVDWQVGMPVDHSFADNNSGWGMNFEGRLLVTPAITVGGFISYQTFLEEIPRQTLLLNNSTSMTTRPETRPLFSCPSASQPATTGARRASSSPTWA